MHGWDSFSGHQRRNPCQFAPSALRWPATVPKDHRPMLQGLVDGAEQAKRTSRDGGPDNRQAGPLPPDGFSSRVEETEWAAGGALAERATSSGCWVLRTKPARQDRLKWTPRPVVSFPNAQPRDGAAGGPAHLLCRWDGGAVLVDRHLGWWVLQLFFAPW